MRLALLAAVAVLGLSACVHQHGATFDPDAITQLQSGVSTTQDARALLGSPSAVSTYADGSQLLQWQYVRGTMVGGSGAHAAILFDKAGRMVRVTHLWRQ